MKKEDPNNENTFNYILDIDENEVDSDIREIIDYLHLATKNETLINKLKAEEAVERELQKRKE